MMRLPINHRPPAENHNPLMRARVGKIRIRLACPVQRRRTSMKTFLASLSLVSALAVPGALAVETLGVSLPTAIDPTHIFAGFVVSCVALLAFGEYGRNSRRLVSAASARRARIKRAPHPLAA
jgi:hypothetical protein